MTDHCQNCTVRGDLEACRTVCERETSNPCDVPLSWGAAARIAGLNNIIVITQRRAEIAEAALSASQAECDRLRERIAGQKELIRTTPAAALAAIAKGINAPMACGHGIDCWDDSKPGEEHCVWCSLASAREAGEETGARNFADWLSEVMLNIRGDIDPRIRYRLPDGRIASGTAVHACERFLATTDRATDESGKGGE